MNFIHLYLHINAQIYTNTLDRAFLTVTHTAEGPATVSLPSIFTSFLFS